MYNRTKKIPTIIGILLLLIGVGGGIYLVETRTQGPSKAQTTYEPSNILKTNITDSSFTVTWLTKEPASGSVLYGTSQKDISQTAFDDRDTIDNKLKPYKTHHVSIKNLSPETVYYFVINSGNNKFFDGTRAYTITTAKKLETTLEFEPSYGNVVDQQNKPAEGALVILTLPQAFPLSTLVKSSGNWLITLNTLRDSNLQPYQEQGTIIESITIYNSLEPEDQAFATTDLNNDSPVPTITIGKTYNFQGLQGKKKIDQEIAGNQNDNSENQILGKATGKKVEVLSPVEGATFVSTKPLIRGKGIPGKEVIIEVNSTQKITGKTTVGKDGFWSWTPPRDLSPDKHTVKITTVDENGEEVVLEKSFLVFKSGTQVLGEATPSGTITTTPTPTTAIGSATPSATLKPLFSPTPIASASKTVPVSGNVSTTFYLIGAGLVLIFIGFAKLLLLG